MAVLQELSKETIKLFTLNQSKDMKTISITDKFQGYLWWSNAKDPEVINGTPQVLELNDANNPFIVEGQLYDTANEVSYSIKYVDGIHLWKEYKLSEGELGEEKNYIPNRMPNIEKLTFKQYWRAELDPLCEGMEVLQPAEFVFVGFKVKEEKV